MKLSISHLAPYLPYGLKAKVGNETRLLSAANFRYGTVKYIDSDGDDYNTSINNLKPLLLPMSSLYTEMEDGAVPIIEIAKRHIEYDEKKGDYDFKLESCFARQIRLDITWMHTAYSEPLYDDRLFIQTQRTHLNPYWVNEYLFSHHFDVWNLIPQNLAIDKTKIK